MLEFGLATWRLTHMLMYERGPYDIFTKFREYVGIRHDEDNVPLSWPDNHVLSCHYCTSIWCALAVLFAPQWIRKVLVASCISIMVEEKWPVQK